MPQVAHWLSVSGTGRSFYSFCSSRVVMINQGLSEIIWRALVRFRIPANCSAGALPASGTGKDCAVKALWYSGVADSTARPLECAHLRSDERHATRPRLFSWLYDLRDHHGDSHHDSWLPAPSWGAVSAVIDHNSDGAITALYWLNRPT